MDHTLLRLQGRRRTAQSRTGTGWRQDRDMVDRDGWRQDRDEVDRDG